MNILLFSRGRAHAGSANFGRITMSKECEDGFTDSDLYRHLLTQYPMSEIDAAIRWLIYGEYIIESSVSIHGPFWKELTDKGRVAADAKRLPDEDRPLLHQHEEPFQVFVAHQFNSDDSALVAYIRNRVLAPSGFQLVDGRADGLEEFRTSILSKIKQARYFVCLVTKRIELTSGTFASSVWLYQETGVAVAYGKRPLLLVEDDIDPQYVGELQGTYEHITFNRSNHPQQFDRIVPRLIADLNANNIPLPNTTR